MHIQADSAGKAAESRLKKKQCDLAWLEVQRPPCCHTSVRASASNMHLLPKHELTSMHKVIEGNTAVGYMSAQPHIKTSNFLADISSVARLPQGFPRALKASRFAQTNNIQSSKGSISQPPKSSEHRDPTELESKTRNQATCALLCPVLPYSTAR